MTRAVTWIGHSTALLEVRGARLLTDPVLRHRLAHLTRRAAPVERAQLERIDAVLISHVHRDHLDLPSLRLLAPDVAVVVPRGAGRYLRGGGEVHELDAGESTRIGDVTVTATPAVHRATRGARRIPALGYVVDDDLYFAGDTDSFDAMARLAPLAVALLPVWGYGTRLGPGHLDPPGAARALALLRPRIAIPIHWGTLFALHRGRSGHRLLTQPPLDFAREAARVAPDVRVAILKPGERLALT